MTMYFEPTDDALDIPLPYFEDARADFAPYYRSHENHSLEDAQDRVRVEFGKLGAAVLSFQPGYFVEGNMRRFGYHIRFYYQGKTGVYPVAGLPSRVKYDPVRQKKEQRTKQDKIAIQALLNVAEQLKAMVTARVFSPGGMPLLPYLLVDGERTLAQVMRAGDMHLALPEPKADPDPVIEAEWEPVA